MNARVRASSVSRLYLWSTASAAGPHAYFVRDLERLSGMLRALPSATARQVDHPEDADAILFIGSTSPILADVKHSSLYRRFPERSYILHGGDEPLPVIPGIYASVSRRWYQRAHHRGGFYLRVALDTSISSMEMHSPSRLFSFVGSAVNHHSRQALLRLDDKDGLIVDSNAVPLPSALARARFIESLRESRFVLCPRGGGTSSFRIFEAMKAARVPVVISDDWVSPIGPIWEDFALRVRESEIQSIPGLLRAHEHDAARMGATARREWERWFGPSTAVTTILGWLSELAESRRTAGNLVMPSAMRIRYVSGIVRHCLRRPGSLLTGRRGG